MATTGTKTLGQLDLFDLLQDRATRACKRLTAICEGNEPLHKELSAKFLAAVADVELVTIEALAGSAGAFIFDNGHLKIAEAPVSKLLAIVLNEVERELDEGKASIGETDIPLLLERVFVEYVLHEVRHRTQGLAEFEDVQALKSVAGPAAMSEYDTLADRDAAMALATLYAEDDSRGAYLSAFRDALFFSSKFFFQIFPIPASRPDKVARAMAILFMAARLAKRDLSHTVIERPDRPLDAPLHVSLSSSQKRLAIHLGEPSKRLLGIANDEDGVGDLISQICDGDYDAALEKIGPYHE